MSNRYVVLSDRRILAISGSDRITFLQGLVSQDVTKVSPSHACYSLLLNAQGKFLFDFFIAHHNENTLWLDVAAGKIDALTKILSLYKLRADVTITPLTASHHVIAVLGDLSMLSLVDHSGRATSFPDIDEVIAFTDPRHASMGARVLAPVGIGETWLQQRGFATAMSEDYTRRRLALGIPEGDDDNIPERTLPLENGLDALQAIDFGKGCYVGQEVTARTKFRATLHKQLYRVEADADLPPAGTPIMLGEREIGRLGSHLEGSGLAVIRSDAVASGQMLSAAGIPLRVNAPEWLSSAE